MKRIIAIVLCFAMLFCLFGCSKPVDEKEIEKINLTLAVENNLSNRAKNTADYFSTVANKLSSGSVNIEVIKVDDPLEALANGADIILANNNEIARANGDFNIYDSPFYFDSYQECTMTLNSASFYDLIENKTQSLLHAKPLCALYDGKRCIVANQNDKLGKINSWTDYEVSIDDSNEILTMMFESLGAELVLYGYENNVKLFRNGALKCVECEFGDVQSLPSSMLAYSNLTVYNTCHYVNLNWFFINNDSYEKLSDYGKGIIKESIAESLAFNDNKILELENHCLDFIKRFKIKSIDIDNNEYRLLVEELMKNNIRYSNIWDWELYYEVKSLLKT